ncbi:MAG: hypothetical protein JJD98_02050 [Polaromonas sp.]|nr:hypothetical protein [Polaromonas sp.]
MIEPLFWNPLPSAAEWLAQKTGRPMDARTLVDTVAKIGKMNGPEPTIIHMMLPKGTRCASLSMFGKPALLPESDVEKFTRDRLKKSYGPLPNGITYLSETYPVRDTLCVNHLLQLLMYGEVTTGLLLNKSEFDGGTVWLMPWGTEHTATLEACGITRTDLLALGDTMTATVDTAPVQNTATPAPVETKAQRQDRRLQACIDSGLPMNEKAALLRLPDGVGDVADREDVTRQAFSTDVKAALKRRESTIREGGTVHRA